MLKLNNKGISIVEVVLTFALIMLIVTGLLVVVVNYRNKVAVSIERITLDTFKDSITQDVYKDILDKGLVKMNDVSGSITCNELNLNMCIEIYYQDNTSAIFGTSKVDPTDKETIENRYFYYDGIKYKLKDFLPKKLPNGRTWIELASINVIDQNPLKKSVTVLEDGTPISIYSINIEVSHIDFKEDFGIHIIASTDKRLNIRFADIMAENIGYDKTHTNVSCTDVQCMIDYLYNELYVKED